MEILMKNSILLVFIVSIFAGGCKKKKSANHYLAKTKDCDALCDKIAKCTDAIYAPSGVPKSGTAKKALSFYKNSSQCKKSCKSKISHEIKFEKSASKDITPSFYRYFIGAQMECIKTPSCNEFVKCQEKVRIKGTNSYPLDETVARRCKQVCEMKAKCSSLLAPRLYGKKFTSLPEDKQAVALRKMGNSKKCITSCRMNFIKERKGITGSVFNSKGSGFEVEFSRFLNCMGNHDCGEFSKCVSKQTL